ncbi:MAG: prepilin-type N-terminal cleavage/methylation domain-containing protein [Candidatus Omnitrophica bacterium]|nr:prepilin-type N-terminal cleavage/methylation domain-containing protein [Candidatus Omnitrophota bacterium]
MLKSSPKDIGKQFSSLRAERSLPVRQAGNHVFEIASPPSEVRNDGARNRKRGLTLLEVIISVGILSSGIITVMQALTYSSRVTGVSSDYVRALFLACDKLQELEFKESQRKPSEAYDPAQESGEQNKLKWNYTIEEQGLKLGDQVLTLYKLNLGISWARKDRKEALQFVTFLR